MKGEFLKKCNLCCALISAVSGPGVIFWSLYTKKLEGRNLCHTVSINVYWVMIFVVPPVIYHEFFGFGRAKGCSLYPILGLHLQRLSHLLLRCANYSLLIIKLSCGVWKIDRDAEGREDVKGGSTHSLIMVVFNVTVKEKQGPNLTICMRLVRRSLILW